MADGREATVVYNSLIGVGVKWGLHNPDPADFEGTDGNTRQSGSPPPGWEWKPEAILREPWKGCEDCGFKSEDCVGEDYEIIKEGTK